MRQQSLNNPERYRDGPAVVREQARHPDGAIDGKPSVSTDVQTNEQIAREQRPPHGGQAASMPNCPLDLRQKRCESLRFEIELGLSLLIRPRMNQIPTGALRQGM